MPSPPLLQVLTQPNFRTQRDFISYATILVIVLSIVYFLVVFASEVVITIRKPGAGKEKKGTKRSRAADHALSVNAQDGGVDGVAKEATSAMVNPLFLGAAKQGAWEPIVCASVCVCGRLPATRAWAGCGAQLCVRVTFSACAVVLCVCARALAGLWEPGSVGGCLARCRTGLLLANSPPLSHPTPRACGARACRRQPGRQGREH